MAWAAGSGQDDHARKRNSTSADLIGFRNRFDLPLSDEQATGSAFYKPADDSAEMRYLRRHREALGGAMPQTRNRVRCACQCPNSPRTGSLRSQAEGKEMSTTMAFVRMLGNS
jgi:pyruvate dehydrogenase E1 component